MTRLMTLIAKTEMRENEIGELQEQVKELTALVQQLAQSDQRDRDQAEYDRQLALKDREIAERDQELLFSCLETKLLSYERRLPPLESSENVL